MSENSDPVRHLHMVETEPRSPEFSDDNLALIFADQNEDRLRYVQKWGTWMAWDGMRWTEDDALLPLDHARRVCREQAARCKDTPKQAAHIASAKTVYATANLARSDYRIIATADQWDSDRMALNTPGGIVDLHSGEMRPQRREDYCTKITAVSPDECCMPALWFQFLDRITGGDRELRSYLARVFGYCLTGETKEHAFFFGHGHGANGKSVLLGTISKILGDYARTASMETFTASKTERHPTDIAALQGARLVTAIETEQGRAWAEAKIKTLTGGDRITARRMKQDPFEFDPQFKLVIAGNHKPSLSRVDESISRRLHLIPFDVTIPMPERDPELPDKLKNEWPGILKWMIDGCLEWQRQGLQPPKAVTAATDEYLRSEDTFAAWLTEKTERDRTALTKSSLLFADWKEWAERAGENPGSNKKFSQNLQEKGFDTDHSRAGSFFVGVRLREREQPWYAQ